MGIIAGVKRLYDLVKVRDEALRCAFYYALRDSLVADNLEQASRIAYSGNKRWARVVTLQVSTHFTPDTCENAGASSVACSSLRRPPAEWAFMRMKP